MYINRICPLVNKANQVAMGNPCHCNEPDCRFQIEGVCAIIGNFVNSQEIRQTVNHIVEVLRGKKL